MGDSLPSNSDPMVCNITRAMHGSSHQYLTSLEKVTKPILYKNPAKMVPLVFLEYTCFCCTRFLPYGMLYHMENTWVFSSITWENAANPFIGENLEK